jgi:hypothetical protein
MVEDELAQDGDRESEAISTGSPEGGAEPTPPILDGQDEGFDLGVLEPPLPLDDETFTEPSKLRLFLRRLLRWLVVVLVIFALGVGATWFARVAPQQKDIDNFEHTVRQLRDEVDLKSAEIEELLPLVDENAELAAELFEAEMHIEILKIQGDVASSQLAMLAEDIVTAKASLAGTDSRLEVLMRSLDGEDRNTVQGMLTRLDLVLEELGEDTFAAIRDLEVLSSNLSALERSIFGN